MVILCLRWHDDKVFQHSPLNCHMFSKVSARIRGTIGNVRTMMNCMVNQGHHYHHHQLQEFMASAWSHDHLQDGLMIDQGPQGETHCSSQFSSVFLEDIKVRVFFNNCIVWKPSFKELEIHLDFWLLFSSLLLFCFFSSYPLRAFPKDVGLGVPPSLFL